MMILHTTTYLLTFDGLTECRVGTLCGGFFPPLFWVDGNTWRLVRPLVNPNF